MNNEILNKTYRLLGRTNVRNFIMQNCEIEPYAHLGKIDRRNIELIENPEAVEKEKRGSCYDQTFLVRKWMNDENIKTRIFYSVTDNLNLENDLYYYTKNVVSHTFLLCFIDSKWKWIEWSWSANIRNKFENEDANEVLKSYRQMAEKSWHGPIKLIEITDIEFNLPMPRLDYLNKCLKNQNEFKMSFTTSSSSMSFMQDAIVSSPTKTGLQHNLLKSELDVGVVTSLIQQLLSPRHSL